jgi:hypothetical protein
VGIWKKREVRVAQESSFAENASSPGSVTWTVSGTVLRPKVWDVDTSGLKLDSVEDVPATGDLRIHPDKVKTIYSGGTVKFKHALTGLGGSGATGAVTTTELGTLLYWTLGAESKTDGTTATAGATTTAVPLTAAGSYVEGEFFALANEGARRIISKSGSTVTTNHALSGAPADTTVVYGTAAYYATQSTPTSVRLLIFGDTGDANNQIMCFGCVGSIGIGGLNPGQLPFIEFTFNVAYWTQGAYSATFTSTDFLDKTISAPGGAGLYFNESGTTTRNNIQSWDMAFELITTRTKDTSASWISNIAGTDTQGWNTTDLGVKGSFRGAFSLDWYNRWRSTSGTAWNVLYIGCSTPGKGWGVYVPTARATEDPTLEAINDKVGQMVKFHGDRGADCSGITTDIAYAPFVIVLW